MRKGQIFTSDLSISIMIFFGFAATALLTINQTFETQTGLNQQKVMERRAEQTASLLVRTDGYPAGWNTSSVDVPGLASPEHVLQADRFLELTRLPETGFRRMFRIAEHAFIEMLQNGSRFSVGGISQGSVALVTGSEQFVSTVNGSGEVWDLYWFDGAAPSTAAENTYTGSRTEMMEAAIQNRSGYSAIVGFNTNINTSDISNADNLSAYTQQGGTYVQVGPGSLIANVSGGTRGTAGASGTVLDNTLLQHNISDGASITFDTPSYYFDTSETVYVEGAQGCLVCSWNSSAYFFTSANLTPASAQSFDLPSNKVYSDTVLGAESLYGTETAPAATDVVSARREVLLNNTETVDTVIVRVIVWRD